MTREEAIAPDLEAVVGGYHGDPYRVLGPHVQSSGWEVRAFLPQASEAQVVIHDVAVAMERVHPDGFYVATLPGRPQPYILRARMWNRAIVEIEDPYRFPPVLVDAELHQYTAGNNFRSYDMLGAHLMAHEGVTGVRFAVWAPNALSVAVTGDFNEWDVRRHPMRERDGGIWELFIPDVKEGARYKYMVRSRLRGHQQMKADPYGFCFETPPRSASVVCDLQKYNWGDAEWMKGRGRRDWLKEPVSMYEVHLESWMRAPGGRWLTYREMADTLVPYVSRMGYTHIELLPPLEHPFSGSWGYQVTGYFAPTSRFGSIEDFMYLVDSFHRAGIGVVVDWVPAHFPKDAHGLAFFDGTALYEHEDPRQGEHHDWGTLIFNYGRNEVRAFLISSALFWLKRYHIDGLRVDAVASMLYLDYSRKPGEWIPNKYGGNENLEAIEFLKKFNEVVHQVPGAITIAEESTAFPGVSRPVYLNGLGFTMKWNMGWMHDMLDYFSKDSVHRKFHHQNITFSLLYAFTENFLLPVSHDEVVHGKRSLLSKMPGDEWQRFANARAFLAYMYTHPGKKLLFMGSEIGQYEEWDYRNAVRWDLLNFEFHRKLQAFVAELNRLYRAHGPLHEIDFHHTGFEWIDFRDADQSVIAFVRRGHNPDNFLVVCCNFTPVPRHHYRFGVPQPGDYAEVLNTDASAWGGSNVRNASPISADPLPWHGHQQSIEVTLPPLGLVVLRRQ
jgi:1,4-alpha-glucan branching enzyme